MSDPRFRIWHPPSAAWPEHPNGFMRYPTCLEDVGYWSDSIPPEESHFLMQSTGILDINGKLIYCSDIVKFDNTSYGGISGIGEIEWISDFTLITNPGWGIFIHSVKKGYALRDTFLGSEVIGNIFETKHVEFFK